MYIKYIVPLIIIFLSACSSAGYDIEFTIQAQDFDLVNAPVYVDFENSGLDEGSALCMRFRGGRVPAQIEILDNTLRRLWWIVNLQAGESMTYKLVSNGKCNSDAFEWHNIGNYSTRLDFGDQPIIQYEHPVFDTGNIVDTHKPYHHIIDPEGSQFITKGSGGLEPHHKGIFLGFSQIFFNDSRVNIWASFNGERSEHVQTINSFGGPVMGGHTVEIHWKDQEGRPFIEEIRQLRAFSQPKGESLVEFTSTLYAIDFPVRLRGDRHHAGVQFRASQYVADNLEKTTFIRPADRGHLQPDVEIGGEEMINMPWNAMYFDVEGKRYTFAYLSHPSNSDISEMSERRYGRMGEYFPHDLTHDNPLTMNYRFWIKAGDKPSGESIDLRYKVFADPGIIRK
jgi:hypothetical protein